MNGGVVFDRMIESASERRKIKKAAILYGLIDSQGVLFNLSASANCHMADLAITCLTPIHAGSEAGSLKKSEGIFLPNAVEIRCLGLQDSVAEKLFAKSPAVEDEQDDGGEFGDTRQLACSL